MMQKLADIVRSLNEPLTPARLDALRDLLPQLEEQLATSQARLRRVKDSPSARRKDSRRQDRPETKHDAVQEIGAYLTTLELTIARVRAQIAQATRLQESQNISLHVHKEQW